MIETSGHDLLDRMAARYAPLSPERWVYEVGCFRIAPGPTHTLDVIPLAFTAAIVTTPNGDWTGYHDRWCYHSMPAAIAAAEEWASGSWPQGEPAGWHRHPSSGRRREHGDPATEHVAM